MLILMLVQTIVLFLMYRMFWHYLSVINTNQTQRHLDELANLLA